MQQKITPFLWFDTQAEEAATFYTSLFKNSRIIDVQRQADDGPAFVVTFELEGQRFTALNGGPEHFTFNESVSFLINCADQAEVDDLWDKITTDGGEPGKCGWCKDRYGLSWQVIPEELPSLLANPRAVQAMLGMSKIDIEAMRNA
jgi:predicted 3-demethylubiquinone-9 3-methyltransferase (glyoxalase superfamily)